MEKVRKAAPALREMILLLQSGRFFHREEKKESLLHFQKEPVKITCLPRWSWASCICLYNKHDPQNYLLITHDIPPIFTVKSSATIQLRAARSL